MGSTRRRFTDEYKAEAVQYVVSSGQQGHPDGVGVAGVVEVGPAAGQQGGQRLVVVGAVVGADGEDELIFAGQCAWMLWPWPKSSCLPGIIRLAGPVVLTLAAVGRLAAVVWARVVAVARTLPACRMSGVFLDGYRSRARDFHPTPARAADRRRGRS